MVPLLSSLLLSFTTAGPQIVSVTKIWDQGKHNAFTDLVRWKDVWYCTFREGDAHVGGDGKLRVLISKDGDKWESIALLEEKGIDLRDPKLSVTGDDRLMIVAGGSVYGGTKKLKTRQPRVAFSKDGKAWTATEKTLNDGDWLWRVTWHDGKCYGVVYHAASRTTPEAVEAAKSDKPTNADPADWKLRLVTSKNGKDYELITHLGVPGHPNETTLRFTEDGELFALVRREGGDKNGWIGRAKAPYKEWTWHATAHRFGGPEFLVRGKELWAMNREYGKDYKTVLAKMTADSYEPVLALPSGGDTSYAGMVWHDGLIWASYYSSHEGKSAIYLAKIRLP